MMVSSRRMECSEVRMLDGGMWEGIIRVFSEWGANLVVQKVSHSVFVSVLVEVEVEVEVEVLASVSILLSVLGSV